MSDDNTAEDLTENENGDAEETAVLAATPMGGLRKASIAVMALGSELAGRIFTLLSPEDVESLLVHAESLEDVTADEVLGVLRELNEQVDHQVAGVSGHEHMIRDAALAALGSDKLSSIMGGESLDAAGQVAARRMPHVMATPLPPLNLSQTGNRCPRKALPPAKTAMSGPSRPEIQKAAAPLPPSSNTVNAARALLPVRSTLVAPMLPEPIWRISPWPEIFVSTSPKGIEPRR